MFYIDAVRFDVMENPILETKQGLDIAMPNLWCPGCHFGA
jgi:hypothetical protein